MMKCSFCIMEWSVRTVPKMIIYEGLRVFDSVACEQAFVSFRFTQPRSLFTGYDSGIVVAFDRLILTLASLVLTTSTC